MATLLYCSFKVPALVLYNEYELGSRYTGKIGMSGLSLMQFSVTSNILKLISLHLFFLISGRCLFFSSKEHWLFFVSIAVIKQIFL